MDDAQARQKLTKIAQEIRSGKISFEDAAKENSEDPGSALKAVNWVGICLISMTQHDALMRLNKGELSQPVQSNFGWHLIQLEDTRNVDKTDAAQKIKLTVYCLIVNLTKKHKAGCKNNASAYVKMVDGRDSQSTDEKQINPIVITPGEPAGLVQTYLFS